MIHMSPEAQRGGPLAKIATGDVIRVDASTAKSDVLADIQARTLGSGGLNP